ncbi:hypothetical protein MTR_3g434740 [Medicago truncatula]|uniref:Uncharacterized protein n=1 Tax=Medicago truncatula TaxID=3880 RepID=A0A072UW33_MEDTR|nr:hypothetical protein MTR_3g434740 [Medicago truncatula]
MDRDKFHSFNVKPTTSDGETERTERTARRSSRSLASHVIQSDDVQVRDKLTVETLPVRIDDRKVKMLRGKEIPLVRIV